MRWIQERQRSSDFIFIELERAVVLERLAIWVEGPAARHDNEKALDCLNAYKVRIGRRNETSVDAAEIARSISD